MSELTRLYLVRHGQTDLNREKRFRGMSDAPLNRDGRAESLGTAGMLKNSGVELVYTSPAPRAVQTAEIVAAEIGADILVDEGIMDVDYGGWQGLTVEEVADRFGRESIAGWESDPGGFKFPAGESLQDVRGRLEPALLRFVSNSRGGNVVAVSHMAVLKTCFLIIVGLGFEWFWKIGIDNGSVSLCTCNREDEFVLQSWNCLPPKR